MIFFVNQISKNYLHVSVYMATVMTIAAGLHACGFQLRGSIDISEDISPIYIEQNNA
jgi:outer membrane lipopolysaccharide assembly protein LptE/RlpB